MRWGGGAVTSVVRLLLLCGGGGRQGTRQQCRLAWHHRMFRPSSSAVAAAALWCLGGGGGTGIRGGGGGSGGGSVRQRAWGGVGVTQMQGSVVGEAGKVQNSIAVRPWSKQSNDHTHLWLLPQACCQRGVPPAAQVWQAALCCRCCYRYCAMSLHLMRPCHHHQQCGHLQTQQNPLQCQQRAGFDTFSMSLCSCSALS
jgi:hypothetical protein